MRRRTRPFGTEARRLPADVIETGDEYRVDIDVPGVEPDDIEVAPATVRGCVVVKKSARLPRELRGQTLLAERGEALLPTARTIPVAWDADIENVRRTMQNGVLTLSIPKLRSGKERTKDK